MKKAILLILILICSAPVSFAADRCGIKVNDFVNHSEYTGDWKIGAEISAIVKDNLPQNRYFVSAASADYILDGSIEAFNLTSRGISSYGVGGFQDYSAKIIISLTLRKADRSIVKTFSVIGRRTQQHLGLSLMGGPVGDDRYKEELQKLWAMKFDSPEFRGSVLGQSVNDAVFQMLPKLSNEIFKSPFGLRGDVVKVRGRDIYLDVGSDNGVRQGQRYSVYSVQQKLYHPQTGKYLGDVPKALVAKVEIVDVSGPNLSVARIIENYSENNIKFDNDGPVKEDDYAVFE